MLTFENIGINHHRLPELPRSSAKSSRLRTFRTPTGFDNRAVHPESRSRSSSVWTAPSPSQTLRSRSPSLPPLPRLPVHDHHLHNLQTTPQHQRSDSSAYYTALWGSPYEVPSSSRVGLADHHHQLSNSTITAEGSPRLPPDKHNSQESFLPPYRVEEAAKDGLPHNTHIPRTRGRGRPPAKSETTFQRPRFGFTQDWLRTHLADRKNSEKGNWWSDESGNSDLETTAVKVLGTRREATQPWLSSGHKSPLSNSPKIIPALLGKTLVHEAEVPNTLVQDRENVVHHKASPSELTLKQKDFDDIFLSDRQKQSKNITLFASMHASIHAAPEAASASISPPVIQEKPLPPPPINRTISEAPVLASATSPIEVPLNIKRPSISAAVSFQRPRKRVLWRGKNCVIALPLDDGISSPKQYLKPSDRQARLKEWEERGFSIRGFELSYEGEGQGLPHGQSRDIYPDFRDWHQDWRDRGYRVSVPDRKAWDEYVNQLNEEKLRALGVSFGDEEAPSRKSPGIPSMSRQQSLQNTMFPHRLPATSSAASSLSQAEHSYSPLMSTSSSSYDRPLSIVSPVPSVYNNKPAVSHFPKPSVSFPTGQPFSHQAHYSLQQQLPTAPIVWHSGPNVGSRGVSPLIYGRGQALRGTQSPVSPIGDVTPERVYFQQDNMLHRPPLQHNLSKIASLQPIDQGFGNQRLSFPELTSKMPAHAHAAEDRQLIYISQPEIASPLPQGHRHNPSESLQKEIDSAEYHLEESIKRQMDEEDELSLTPTTNDEALFSARLSNGNRLLNSFTESERLSKTTASDFETNPSLSGSPSLSADDALRSGPISGPNGHTSKASTSKLNVNAREFVFDPQKSFTPSMFAFSGENPSLATPSLSARVPGVPQSKPKVTSYSSNLNVAAPAFTPSGFQNKPVPTREFSFSSSSMPALKPDAPDFKPSRVISDGGLGNERSGSEIRAPKIFEHFDFSQISQSAKASKAIPIIKPAEALLNNQVDSDGEEDEEGRITQAAGRQKRARRTGDDGDQVPMFAPSGGDTGADRSTEVKTSLHTRDSSLINPLLNFPLKEEEQPFPVNNATDQLEQLVDEFHGSDASTSLKNQSVSEANEIEKQWEPFELADAAEAANFNLARPSSSMSVRSKISRQQDAETNPCDQVLKSDYKHTLGNESGSDNRESLSATVQPYEYNPDHAAFQFDIEENGGLSRSETSESGLAASRYAPQQASHRQSSPPLDVELPGQEVTGSPARSLTVERQHIDDVVYMEPSFQEIDDVMKHMNEDPDIGIERVQASQVQRSSLSNSARSASRSSIPIYHGSSDSDQHLSAPSHPKFPSSSPNRLQQAFQYLPERNYGSSDSAAAELVARNARFSPSYKPPKHAAMVVESPIHRLNSLSNLPISDWDDVISSGEDAKLRSRTNFFDQKVEDLIGAAVQERLYPLEKNLEKRLAEMSESLDQILSRSTSRRPRRSMSAEVENSDADDEDDDEELSQVRARSPLKDRKFERLKASILDAVAVQHKAAGNEETAKVMESIAELRASIQQQKSSPTVEIKTVVEEAVARQMRGKSAPVTSSHQSATAEKYQLQIAGLESMLKIAEDRAEDELRGRRHAEDALAESQRLLRNAQFDAAEQRESAELTEGSLRMFHEERVQVVQQSALLAAAKEHLEKTVTELSEKNSALEDTLEEYRLSSKQWREEIDEAKSYNKNLDRTIHALKAELEDGIRGRRAFKDKFDRLQEEMATVTRNVARDQSLWRRREEEHKARHEMQSARLEAEARTRERLELEIERLEAQEKETMKSRFLVDHVQGENARLEALANELKADKYRLEEESIRFQRELHDTKETARLDIQRVQNAMEADMENAHQELKIVRTDLQSIIARLQTQLEDAKADAATVKARYELMLEEASESRDNALRDAAEAREAALQEHYRFHERTLEEMKAIHDRAMAAALEESHSVHKSTLAALTEDRDRALKNATEDKHLTESRLNERLLLADQKVAHYQDCVTHLEEKLQIAKAAAQAAAQAAQSARASPSPTTTRVPAPIPKGSDVGGKISPQALRETILVLQEQLHERENQIEKLQQELATVDKDAPTKVKERDTEISWLRELLFVRVDELENVVATISQPAFDASAVRDAAIRLKTNLQMEQQMRERAMAGGPAFPTIASLTNIASPGTIPYTAASAISESIRGRFGSFAGFMNGSANQTPSKSSPQSAISGIFTPPNTNQRPRQHPAGPSTVGMSPYTSRRPLQPHALRHQSTPRQSFDKSLSEQPAPETPRLYRKASYDQDATSEHFSFRQQEQDDDESTVDGIGGHKRDEEPFGPSIGN